MSVYNMLMNLQLHCKQFVINPFGPCGPFKQAEVWILLFIDMLDALCELNCKVHESREICLFTNVA